MPRTHRRAAVVVPSIPEQPEKALPTLPKPLADDRLSLQPEFLAKILTEVTPLLMRHHQELAYEGAFDPDWHMLLSMNVAGRLRIMTARKSGVLVGYIANRVDPSLFSRKFIEASIDLYYLSPAYRSGWDGVRMFVENDRWISAWGVDKVYVSAVLSYQDGRIRSVFKRLGYTMTGEMWCRDG